MFYSAMEGELSKLAKVTAAHKMDIKARSKYI